MSVTSMTYELAPGLLECSSSCQVYMQPVKGLVSFSALGHSLPKGIEGQQLVSSNAGREPGLFQGWNALDAGVHDLVGAAEAVGDDSEHRVAAAPSQ